MELKKLAKKLQLLYNDYIAPYEEARPITDYIELITNTCYLGLVINEVENIVKELEIENCNNMFEINEIKEFVKELKKRY